MITSILLKYFFDFCTWAISGLPVVSSMPYNIDILILQFGSMYMALATIWPPLSLFRYFFFVGTTVEFSYFLWKIFNWSVNKVRGSG